MDDLTHDGQPTPAAVESRARRWSRRIGRILAILVGVVVLAAMVFVLVPSLRVRGLERGLEAGLAALPGEATVEIAWPQLGRVELDGFVWTFEGDEVVRVERAVVDLDLAALLGRAAVVDEVRVESARVRQTAMDAALASMPTDTTSAPQGDPTPPTAAIDVPWLQPGALEGLPAIALESLLLRQIEWIGDGLEIRLDELDARVDLRPGGERIARLDLDVRAPDHGRLRGGLVSTLDDSLRVVFDVWDWTPPDRESTPPAEGEGLTVVLPSDLIPRLLRGETDVIPLRADGRVTRDVPADLRLSARWEEGGAFDASILLRLDRPPTWIETWISPSDTTVWAIYERLRATWPEQPYVVDADVTGHLRGSETRLDRVELDASLPGPAQLIEGLDRQTWSRAEIALDVEPLGNETYAVRLDLGSTRWIETGTVSGEVDLTGNARADTLALRFPGLSLRGRGAWQDGAIDADVRLTVSTRELEDLVPSPPWQDYDARLEADVSASGTFPLPRSSARVEGEVSGPFGSVPAMTLRAEHEADSVRVDLDLPDGATIDGQRYALPLGLRARGRLDLPRWSGRAEVDVPGLLLSAVASADSVIDADASLVVRFEELQAALPESLAAQVDATTLQRVELEVDGSLAPDRGAVGGSLELTLRLDEGDFDLHVEAEGDRRGFVRARIDSLRARWREESLRTEGRADLSYDPALPRITIDGLSIRGSIGTLRASAEVDSSGAKGRLEADLATARGRLVEWLPRLHDALPPADSLAARLTADLSGTAARPRADLRGLVRLPHDQPIALRWTATYGDPADDAETFTASAELDVADSTWVDASLSLPVAIDLQDMVFALREDRVIDFDLRTTRIDLDRVEDRLRPPVSLEGSFRTEVHGQGPLGDLRLEGFVRSDDLQVEMPDGSWVAASVSVDLRGSYYQPTVDGQVTVERGLIMLPEPPPALLPHEGEAMLWTAIDTVDSLGRPLESPAGTPVDTMRVPVPDVRVAVDVPGGLRLRGQGLDVELRGRIEIIVEDGVPRLGGNLAVARGTLDLLGRRFRVETGQVRFDPDQVDPNPELDIRLATDLEGTRYTVTVTGTALEPRLELGSEPSMPEGDIVSALLFGRPLDELDEGQADLLAQRTREIAAAYGAAVLSQRVGQRLGVDILSIQPGGEDGATSLVVGQYLSPDVIVQYEQVLEEGAAALVRLEYMLTRTLVLEGVASQGEGSGVQILWQKDY